MLDMVNRSRREDVPSLNAPLQAEFKEFRIAMEDDGNITIEPVHEAICVRLAPPEEPAAMDDESGCPQSPLSQTGLRFPAIHALAT